MDQLWRAEEANWQWMSVCCKCHSIAWLSAHTPPGVMSVFFNHLHCRTSTMAQVPTSVAKSLFNNMQLSLSNMKTSSFESCCNYLKQHSPPYAPKGAKITWPVMAGYGLVMEKKKSEDCIFPISIIDPWTQLNNRNGECIELALDMVAYLHWFLCCS